MRSGVSNEGENEILLKGIYSVRQQVLLSKVSQWSHKGGLTSAPLSRPFAPNS